MFVEYVKCNTLSPFFALRKLFALCGKITQDDVEIIFSFRIKGCNLKK